MRRAVIVLATLAALVQPAHAKFGEMDDLAAEQAKEKLELEDMKREMRSIRGEVDGAIRDMEQLPKPRLIPQAVQSGEVHLFAREADIDLGGGATAHCLTFNGQIPGPEIHVVEGETLRVVLHNELKTATSLHFHGLELPQNIDGLPRAGNPEQGARPERYLRPAQNYAYILTPQNQASAYYHPQIMHLSQRQQGMYGALVVHPRLPDRSAADNRVLFLNKLALTGKNAGQKVFVINGKTAPHIPALEVKRGSRVRLRVVNLCEEDIPLHLSGHRFEVVSQNGSDPLEPRVARDTVTLSAGSRMDLEFACDNPGVWSLASEKCSQNQTADGKFPGGIAMVVRYKD